MEEKKLRLFLNKFTKTELLHNEAKEERFISCDTIIHSSKQSTVAWNSSYIYWFQNNELFNVHSMLTS